MKRIRTLIVDDESLAREGISERLKKYSDIDIIGECESGEQAYKVIKSEKPDLLFLDIQMPELDGFEMLDKLGIDEIPYTIFVTAFDSYAIKAFEVNALDYLLKPIDTSRFGKAVEKAIARIKNDELIDFSNTVQSLLESKKSTKINVNRLVVKDKGKIFFLEPEDVYKIEAAGDYINIYTENKKYLLRESLIQISKRLDEKIFVRIHRSTIINVTKISALKHYDRGDYVIYLSNNDSVKLSRNYKANLEEVINCIF